MGSKNLIRNAQAGTYVAMRQSFQGANLYAQTESATPPDALRVLFYVVYSYGPHFPLFVYDPRDGGVWYENEDRYSVTTSKHRSQSHPHVDTIKVSTAALKNLIATGKKPGEE